MTIYGKNATISTVKIIKDERGLPTNKCLLGENTSMLPDDDRLRKIKVIGQLIEIYRIKHPMMKDSEYGPLYDKFDSQSLSELQIKYQITK